MMSNPELFLVKREVLPDKMVITYEVQDRALLGSDSPDRDLEGGNQEEEEEDHRKDGGGGCGCIIEEIQEKELCKDIYCETSLVGANLCPLDCDDGGGFRTPVSADHKITSATECPPAPKKPKPVPVPWRKRKLSSTDGRGNGRISLAVHLSDEEVEAMFPPIVPSEAQNKIKKARRSDDSHKK